MKLFHKIYYFNMFLATLAVSFHQSSAFLTRKRISGRTFSITANKADALVIYSPFGTPTPANHSRRQSTSNAAADDSAVETANDAAVPLYRVEGLFAVEKPLDWTSNNVVSYIRGILERDARDRGADPVKVGSRRNKSRIVRVGHGGTLDPLATGVLVVGVGKGTKQLQSYLSGSKGYRAIGEFGFETATLDMEGNITKTAPFDHISMEQIEGVIPLFTGKIMQVPPIFSAIRKGGKKLYKSAREGVTADEIEIEPREVEIMRLELINQDSVTLPKFEIEMECGGGTFVRSLIRDIGYKLNSVATTTRLERFKQGQFTLEHCLQKDNWDADNIYAAIEKMKSIQEAEEK